MLTIPSNFFFYVCLYPGNTTPYLCPASRDSLDLDSDVVSPVVSLDLVSGGNGNNQLNETSTSNKKEEQRSEHRPFSICEQFVYVERQQAGVCVC